MVAGSNPTLQSAIGAGEGGAPALHLAPMLAPVARAILENAAGSAPSLRLRLEHDELGGIEITLRSGRGGVTVEIRADRPETARLLSIGSGALAQELRAAGLGLESVTIGGGHAHASGEHSAAREGASDTRASTSSAASPESADAGLAPAPRRPARASALDILV